MSSKPKFPYDPASNEKRCTKCLEVKPLSEFYNNKRMYDGKHSQCAICIRLAMKLLRHSHPEKSREYSRMRYANNKTKHSHSRRQTTYKRKFNITIEEYEAMLANQGGVCSICGRTQINYRLSVDHNHSSGKIRGILCARCNTSLSRLEDVSWRRRAEYYLASGPMEFNTAFDAVS